MDISVEDWSRHLRANLLWQADTLREICKPLVRAERVKYRIAVDPNHEEVSIVKRFLQIAESLILITETLASRVFFSGAHSS